MKTTPTILDPLAPLFDLINPTPHIVVECSICQQPSEKVETVNGQFVCRDCQKKVKP